MMRMRELEAATKAKEKAVCFLSFHGVSAEMARSRFWIHSGPYLRCEWVQNVGWFVLF
jgi:hypothetical protein